MSEQPLEIFAICPPGFEKTLEAEARALGFAEARTAVGGVELQGGWPTVWRANLHLRGATRILARLGGFRAMHLAQLDKRARKFPWSETLRPDVPLRVEVTTNRKNRIYHAKAAAQRIETALRESLGAQIAEEAPLTIKARIADDFVTFSVDTSGESLHRRGFKEAVNKAPMRETLAALFLREMGFDGSQPLIDPMCGSGTFPIEAAEIALGLAPGRARSFAFEHLASFDAQAWAELKAETQPKETSLTFHGADRDQGAVTMSQRNAAAAGISAQTHFTCAPLSELTLPDGPKGILLTNPPYGTRIGNKKPLFALYGSLGTVLRERFQGWRAGLITSDPQLAKATSLNLKAGPYIPHGGLKVRLYQTQL